MAAQASQRGRHRRVALAGAHLFADEMWKKKRMLPKSPGANSSRAPAARSRRGTRGFIRLATAGAMSGAKAGAVADGSLQGACKRLAKGLHLQE